MLIAIGILWVGVCSGYLLCLSRMGENERDMKRDVTSASKRTETTVPKQRISGLVEVCLSRSSGNTSLVIQKRILGRG